MTAKYTNTYDYIELMYLRICHSSKVAELQMDINIVRFYPQQKLK